MLTVRGHRISIMVIFGISLHLWWSLMIVLDLSALNATGLSSLYRYIHSPFLLAAIMAIVALMASVGMFARLPWMIALLMPQQILLMMSAAGVIEAIWLAQFADGVVRPRAFIAADQMYSILAAIGHTAAVVFHAINEPNR